jgi:hypothetical protein
MNAAAQASDEAALQAFLATLPSEAAVPARTLAHAWTAADGSLHVGKLTVRLLARGPQGHGYTAATLHGTADDEPRLEIARVLLVTHGLAAADWTAWCDDRAELTAHGFEAGAKYPVVRLTGLPPATQARLALGLRDLCRLAHGQPS